MHKCWSIILNIIAIVECAFSVGIVFVIGHSFRSYSSSSDTIGVGYLILIMGTIIGIALCVLLAFSGLGLLRRKQSGRILNIGIALLLIGIIGEQIYMNDGDCDITEMGIFIGAAILLVLMFLPSVKKQFVKTKP